MSDTNHAESAFEFTVEPVRSRTAIEALWRELEIRTDASFFQSWPWIGTLLATLPASVGLDLLCGRLGGEIVCLGLLARNSQIRHGFVHARGLWLNETGRNEFDCLTIEYNGLLVDRAHASAIPQHVVDWLCRNRGDWDELNISGLANVASQRYRAIAAGAGLRIVLRDRKPSNHVDLAAVREEGGNYLDRLSSNSRHQIRRSIRLYEEVGPVALTAAQSTAEALDYLDRLKSLHQSYWQARGHPGSFASSYFEAFHRALIERCFDAGNVQMVRVAAGKQEIGFIYNFVKGSTVYQYQSGFLYDQNPKFKPGLVSHYLAILHSLERGADVYDFLAGESQHKRSLGTGVSEMDWLTLQRNRLKYRIENGLRDIRDRLVSGRAT